jgi:hypothetical protein
VKEFDNLPLHPLSERIVQILTELTQTDDDDFFRVLTAYQLTKIPSMLQVTIDSPDRGIIPINFYGINLAPSGHGKGHATNIFEDRILNEFVSKFLNTVAPAIAEINLEKLAIKQMDTDLDSARAEVHKEYERAGIYQPVFDSATAPAIKQLRQRVLMANTGALNLEVDEIGSNILATVEALGVYLELYDMGKVKNKLIKHTSESKHFTPIKGFTPANLMMFGTPTRLLNADKEEEEFYRLLETGYARRCFFGYTRYSHKKFSASPEAVYEALTGTSNNAFIKQLQTSFGNLGSLVLAHSTITVSKAVALRLIEYKIACEKQAQKFSEYEEIRKAEITHRYFKALKLAGTYAFIEGCKEVSIRHLDNAIALAQKSGIAFGNLQQREKNYVKLAKYLRDCRYEVTHADMIEDLPFFKGSAQTKQDMMKLAQSYGYKNNIIIKSHFINGIEFLSASSLKETSLDNMIISVSKDIAAGYKPKEVPFEKLVNFGKTNDVFWCNHQFTDGNRNDEAAIKGFNLLVFDVENSVSLDMAKMLLRGYKAIIHTTKRHTSAQHRYRVIIPTNYVLELEKDTYKEFVQNLYTWLPFDADTAVGQRARAWSSNAGQVEVLDGELFDVLPFIPQTQKNEERIKTILNDVSLTALERWFTNNTGLGNRSNQLIKYALMLVDSGKNIAEINTRITDLNSKLPDPLPLPELRNTILATAAKKIQSKGKP